MDEENFPRGGENLQLKEKKKKKKVDRELFQDAGEEPRKSKEKKEKKKVPVKTVKTTKDNVDEDVVMTPEALMFKHVCDSMLVLGYVLEVKDTSIDVALPNDRRGCIPITEISDAYSKCLQAFAETSGETMAETETLHSLVELFHVGMLLSCQVTHNKPPRLAFRLSINPRLVNENLSVDSVMNGTVFYGSISSCEDTGYIVDTGVQGIKAFLKNKDARSYINTCNNGKRLIVGQSVRCKALQKKSPKKLKREGDEQLLSLTIDPDQLNEPMQNKEPDVTKLIPGMKVTAKITNVEDEGVLVSFMKMCGVIHFSHLPDKLSTFSVGDEILSCILYVRPGAKFVTLSALPHIVNYSGEPTNLLGFGSLFIGSLVRDATVRRVKKSSGVLVQLEGKTTGLADINNIDEDMVYEKGSRHMCIVTAINCEENKATVSFKEDTIKELVRPCGFIGNIVTGVVEGIEKEQVKVSIMERFTGKLTKRNKDTDITYKAGLQFKCRVLFVTRKGILILSNKPWALESKYPVISSLDHLRVNDVVEGSAVGINSSKVTVGFYGTLEGSISKKKEHNKLDSVKMGDRILCRVVTNKNALILRTIDHCEEFEVPKELVPRIVGKRGKTVKEIENRTATHITLTENKCQIFGTKENTERAKEEVLRLKHGDLEQHKGTQDEEMVMDQKKKDRKRSASESSEGTVNSKKQKLIQTEEILEIEKTVCGRLIGKGGKTIEQLRSETGAELKIMDHSTRHSMRVCRLRGTKEQVKEAKERIEELLQKPESPEDRENKTGIKRSISESCDNTTDIKKQKFENAVDSRKPGEEIIIASEQVGRIIGKAGRTISKIRFDSGARVEIEEREGGGGDRNCLLFGSEESVAKAKSMIEELLIPDWSVKTAAEDREELHIPKEQIGRIIGKGGETVARIRSKSGAFIKIEDSEIKGAERKLSLSGSEESVTKAMTMLEEIMSSPNKKGADGITVRKEIHIPTEQIGKIIGKGGQTVVKIRTKSGAFIKIEDSEIKGAKRVLSLSGTEESVTKALSMIEKLLHLDTPVKKTSDEDRIREKLHIPKKQIGSIIGKKGQTVAEIRTKSGAFIKIEDSEKVGEDRTLSIFGTKESVTKAMSMIEKILDSDSPEKKSVDDDKVREELHIPKEQIGSIIGKKGQTVAEIRSKSGAFIKIEDSEKVGEDRTLSISGTKESVTKAMSMIEKILDSDSPEKKSADDEQIREELHIPKEQIGSIIGKKGQTVAKIRSKSGAFIKIEDGEIDGEDRKLSISGTKESVTKAMSMIEKIMDSDSPQKKTADDKIREEMHIPKEQIGKVIGKGGKTVSTISTKSGAFIKIADSEIEGAGSILSLSGTEEAIKKAKTMIEKILNPDKPADEAADNKQYKEEISIPSEFIGKVIGKGGQTISKIQSESGGAKIKIEQSKGDGEDRTCKLLGTEESVWKAKNMIEKIINPDLSDDEIPERSREVKPIEDEFESSDSEEEEDPDSSVVVTIPIIGQCVKTLSQNEKFKTLLAGSEVKIVLEQDEEDEEGDGICTITGPEADVMKTKQKIEKLLKKMEKKEKKDKVTLQLSNSLSWDTEFKLPDARRGESSGEESEDEEIQKPVKKTKAERQKEKLEEEKRIYEYERKKLDGDVVPETADDFDRLVVNSPNSSVVWLRYMAFHLETSEIDKARAVAERALKTISFREEREKQNIWVAYLNLENMYGTNETVGKVMSRAIQQCEPLDIYLPLVNIYVESSKTQEAERLYLIMAKKYSNNKLVWAKFGEFYFQEGKQDSARKLLQRALKSLENRDHIETITKFAQMEFKHGEPERGKTMFENILSTYPKRTDIWSVYVDLLTKLKDHTVTRGVYNRMIGLKLPAKKIKFFFKKFTEFEEKYGTESQKQDVLQKALKYVESGGTAAESVTA